MNTLYQHFDQSETAFIQKVEEWIATVEEQYTFVLTPFLNIRERYILTTLCRHYGCRYEWFSHIQQPERMRCLIVPDYYVFDEDDFEVMLLRIDYNKKFNTLSHPQILGTLLSLGIHREQLGDIIDDGQDYYVETTKTMGRYFLMNVTKMGGVSVTLKEENKHHIIPKNNYCIEKTTISSFRLDNILATVYNISRQRAKECIQKKDVNVNYVTITHPDFQVSCDDLISVRHLGRCYLTHIDEHKTKKDRYRIHYAVIRK